MSRWSWYSKGTKEAKWIVEISPQGANSDKTLHLPPTYGGDGKVMHLFDVGMPKQDRHVAGWTMIIHDRYLSCKKNDPFAPNNL